MLEKLNEELANFIEEGKPFGITQTQAVCSNILSGKYVEVEGKKVLDFSRLDYMALGSERKIKQLMIDNINQYDISCPASQIILKPGLIAELEQQLATWHRLKTTLVFSNGYSANINLMQALGMRLRTTHLSSYVRASKLGNTTRNIPTVFLVDSQAHYSLIHGIRISKKLCPNHCYSYGFKTNDANDLENALQKVESRFGTECIKIIVSDTLTSGLGHKIDVGMLYAKAEKHDTLLYLDEAHAVGILGPERAGLASDLLPKDFEPRRVIIMGTLTKAIGQLGGYACFGDHNLAALVRAASPQYLFSAPLLPWMAKTITTTIDLLAGSWGQEAVDTLMQRANYLRSELHKAGFDTLDSTTQIVPILIGDIETCIEIRTKLLGLGFNVAAFVFPAMPSNQSILRISMCRDISFAEIDFFVQTLTELCRPYGDFKQNCAEIKCEKNAEVISF